MGNIKKDIRQCSIRHFWIWKIVFYGSLSGKPLRDNETLLRYIRVIQHVVLVSDTSKELLERGFRSQQLTDQQGELVIPMVTQEERRRGNLYRGPNFKPERVFQIFGLCATIPENRRGRDHRIQVGWLKWIVAKGVLCDKKVPLKLKVNFIEWKLDQLCCTRVLA